MLKYTVPSKAAIFLIFTIPFFLLTACKDCSKKVPCPGYEDAMLDAWFPYTDKQVLVFKSNTNLFDTLQLFLAESTTAYDYTTGLGSTNRGCFANKSFATTKKDSSYYATFRITLSSVQDAYSTTQKRSAHYLF